MASIVLDIKYLVPKTGLEPVLYIVKTIGYEKVIKKVINYEVNNTCYAKSHLLAALLRANKIPAGFCYQVLQRDPQSAGLVLHGLNGIFVKKINRWVRVDARGNIGSFNAQFDIEKEQLAYTMDKDLSEFIYETIFADPDTNVINVLKSFKNRNEMWPHLPNELAKTGST